MPGKDTIIFAIKKKSICGILVNPHSPNIAITIPVDAIQAIPMWRIETLRTGYTGDKVYNQITELTGGVWVKSTSAPVSERMLLHTFINAITGTTKVSQKGGANSDKNCSSQWNIAFNAISQLGSKIGRDPTPAEIFSWMNDWIIAFTTKAGEHNIQSDPIMQGGDITLLINAAKQWQGAIFFYNHGSDTRILVSHRSTLLGDNESKNCFNFPIFSIIRPTEGGAPSLRYIVLLPLLLFDPAVSECRTQLWRVQAERKGDTTFPAQTGDDVSGLKKPG